MSPAEQIAQDHQPAQTSTTNSQTGVIRHSRKCSCGHDLPWHDWQEPFAIHRLEVAIETGRAQTLTQMQEWATKHVDDATSSTQLAIRAAMAEGITQAARAIGQEA